MLPPAIHDPFSHPGRIKHRGGPQYAGRRGVFLLYRLGDQSSTPIITLLALMTA